MTAKEYLRQIYIINNKIRRLEQERESIRADLFSVRSTTNYNADKVQTSASGDQMLRLIAKADKLERDIVSEIDRLVCLKASITREIEAVSDETCRDLLFRRYVLLQSWEMIAVGMGYTIRHIYRMHGRALQLFRKNVSECH